MRLTSLLLALTISVLCTVPTRADDNKEAAEVAPGLVGEYFALDADAKDFSKLEGRKPGLVRIDRELNFPIGSDFNGLKFKDRFYARWTGFLRVPSDGKYTLINVADDAARVYLDDKLVIENGVDNKGQFKNAELDLEAGDHPVKVEYVQSGEQSTVQLGWTPPDGQTFVVPAENLFHVRGAERAIEWEQAAYEEKVDPNAPPHEKMDYGRFLSATVTAAEPAGNVAVKGVAIKLGKGKQAAVCFDMELLRYSAGWTNGFLELKGVAFDGRHGDNPAARGELVFGTRVLPGCAGPGGKLDADPRPRTKDQGADMPYGPLPRDWAKYKGLFRNGDNVVLSYSVGKTDVLELPGLEGDGMLTRTLSVGPSNTDLVLRLADADGATGSAQGDTARLLLNLGDASLNAVLVKGTSRAKLEVAESTLLVRLPASDKPSLFKIALYRGPGGNARTEPPAIVRELTDPVTLTKGGPARWTKPIETKGVLSTDNKAPYVVDTLTVPFENPYNAWMRFGGVDFFKDGKTAAVCTWSGDVWLVSGIDDKLEKLTWKRFATGLYQALGLKIVDDVVYVHGRDQLTRLRDLNSDGEADFYECFNNDVTITPGFHEFAFDLHTDPDGNFYFIKGGAVRGGGSGFEPIVPHHGTVLRVSPDGSKLDVVATGFRAPNGMGVGPDGQITSGDNQGTWTPACRLNWIKPGGFYGVVDLAHRDPPPTVTDNPLCWFPMGVDNSSGGQVWVTSDKWGPFQGQLLHLSYGQCKLFKVMYEEIGNGQVQGGVVRFPLNFESGVMRGRFNAADGQLYLCGLRGWQTTAGKDACLQRVRYTGKPANMPTGLKVKPGAVEITFTDPVDADTGGDPGSYGVEHWNYEWTSGYGSPEVKPSNTGSGHDEVEVAGAKVSEDGRTVTLQIPTLKPVMQMQVRFNIDSADGTELDYTIWNTINRVGDDKLVVRAPEK